MSNAGAEFTRLVEIMATLRSPEGCPWDREQTLQSLSQYVLEEAYEVVDAIERGRSRGAARRGRRPHLRGRLPVAGRLGMRARSPSPTPCRRSRTSWCGATRTSSATTAACTTPSRRSARRRPPRRSRGGTRRRPRKRPPRARPRPRSAACREACPPCTAPTRSAAAPPPSASTGPTAADVVGKIEEEVAELRETLDRGARQHGPCGGRDGRPALRDRQPVEKARHRARGGAEKGERQVHRTLHPDGTADRFLGRQMTEMSLEALEDEWQTTKRDMPKEGNHEDSKTRRIQPS